MIGYIGQQDPEDECFIKVTSLMDGSVSGYQSRATKNLMVSFGCTEGQLRSLFLAEQLTAYLPRIDDLKGTMTCLWMKKLDK